MSESTPCYVHTENDPDDVLFTLPPMSRELRMEDTFEVTLAGQSAVTYKVETVNYKLVEEASANPNNPHNFWKSREIFYGVSIVP